MLQELILGIDSSIEENPRKMYVGYRTTQNIVCMEVQNQKILLFLKLDPKQNAGPPGLSRDVSQIGHYGTGDVEITIKTAEDVDQTMPHVELAYRAIGG